MDRRAFLQTAGLVAAASAVPLKTQAAVKPKGLSILQGFTTETTTQLTVDVGVNDRVAYSLTDTQTRKVIQPESVKSVPFGSSETRVDKIKFSGLELGHRYQLTVKESKTNAVLDSRFLKTVDLNKQGARIALMSCMNDMFGSRNDIWKAAEASDVDYIFFLGDNVYGDFVIFHGPGYLWSRYVSTREAVPFYRWKELKPVIAIWDDHDFGKNDSGGKYKHKDSAYFIFKTFFAQEPDQKVLWNGFANSVYFRAFNQNFVFFDNRYYRDLQNTDGSKSFLGHQQIDWMSQAVRNNPVPTWIMEGSPIYSGVEKKSSYYATAPDELDYFMKSIRSWNTPVIFAAGDLHLSELAKIDKSVLGYETYELISSCMHSTSKSKFYSHPFQQMHGYLKQNFHVLEQVGKKGEATWKATCIGKKKVVPYETTLSVG